MASVFIVFPPGAGGNHLKNIVVSCYQNVDISLLYGNYKKTVHANIGLNLQYNQIENAVLHPNQVHVLHGHFGEVMSFQQQVRSLDNKKFIILSPDTPNDRQLLNARRRLLGYKDATVGDYFDGEQVFLYEPFMYHWYFQVPMENIMNISISEWFDKDINSVLDRISYFLQLPINKEQISNIHSVWVDANQ